MSETEISLDEVYSEQTEVAEVETVEVVTEETEEPVKAEPEAAKAEELTTDSKEPWTLTAVMDEREKRQAAVKENEELKAKLASFEKPQEDVSVFEDEQAFKEQQQNMVQTEVANAKLSMSRAYAVRELGEEAVAQAEVWYAQEGLKSPYAIDRVNQSDLKFHEAVELMREDQARRDPDAYKARLRAEILEELKSIPSNERETITPSLASKRSTGKATEATEDFEDMLNP